MLTTVLKRLQSAKNDVSLSPLVFKHGQSLFASGACQPLLSAKEHFEYLVEDEHSKVRVLIRRKENELEVVAEGFPNWYNRFSIAALFQLSADLQQHQQEKQLPGIKYSREGMMQRVLKERQQKAKKANYQIELADNIYGEHVVINETGKRYSVFLRDFKTETGYSDSMDWRTNKLGTTKHIMFAFNYLKERPDLLKELSRTYPFVEIYADPLHQNQVTWHYPHTVPPGIARLLEKYFGKEKHLPASKITSLLSFSREAEQYPQIKIRPEVIEKVGQAFDEQMLDELANFETLDFTLFKLPLFPYQQEGIQFATFRKATLLADEMGLGKSVQAIGTALFKKQVFGFSKVLVVAPASLKQQWAEEIEKFTEASFQVVNGSPSERKKDYQKEADFIIAHYEQVMHDVATINEVNFDVVILDEAQRIRNFSSKTFEAVNQLHRKHAMILTGTPIETQLLDLYSLVFFLDPFLISPLWEFSQRYCLFDQNDPEKVVGYYQLNELRERIKGIFLRKEKKQVMKELPEWQQVNVPIGLSDKQRKYIAQFSKELKELHQQKQLTAFDQQKSLLLVNKIRMACNSPWMIDQQPAISPKIEELKYILQQKLQVKESHKKVVIFSEWVKMHRLITKLLRDENIGFVELSGEVPIEERADLVEQFEKDESCSIFLTTEVAEEGLNLQVADTLINIEPPLNQRHLQQRLNILDRIGQEHRKLTVINLYSRKTLEERLVSGFSVNQKQLSEFLSAGFEADSIDLEKSSAISFEWEVESQKEPSPSLPAESKKLPEKEEKIAQLLRNQWHLFSAIAKEKPELLEKTPAFKIKAETDSKWIIEVEWN